MARATEHRFTVAGVGAFPIDMLRYDGCTPEREQDSYSIANSFREHAAHTVKLRGPREPTNDRWESFRWRVAHHEKVR